MVLVEVCEPVVQKDWRANVVRDLELNSADVGFEFYTVWWRSISPLFLPLWFNRRRIGGFERGDNIARWYVLEV